MENLFKIIEEVHGFWSYHISHKDNKTKSLCGEDVMDTSMKFENWGVVSHLRERYCKDCLRKALAISLEHKNMKRNGLLKKLHNLLFCKKM